MHAERSSAEGKIYSFGFSPDASRVIIGQITKISVWDVAAGIIAGAWRELAPIAIFIVESCLGR